MRRSEETKRLLVTWCLVVGAGSALAPACADENPGVSPDGQAGAESDRAEGGYGGESLDKLSAVAHLGTDGGELTIDVATLTVPPGALTAEVEIRVAELSSGATNALPPTSGSVALESRPVAFEPHGQTFTKPVTIQLDYPAGASSSFVVLRLSDPDDDSWEHVFGASLEDGKATFMVTSFSIYAVFADPEGEAEHLYGGQVVPPEPCGNGALDAGEGCDFGDTTAGDGCSASCMVEAGYACDDVGCTLLCGNDTVDAGEECEDTEGPWSCDPDCTFVVCGDGYTNVGAGEICDTAGTSASCDDDCSMAGCGDGTLNAAAGEDCETPDDGESCDADCTFVVCGDGHMNTVAGEGCDDGELLGGDGCSATCTEEPGYSCDASGCVSLCGNGTVESPETCDDNGTNTDGCDHDCTAPACGDGITNIFAGEDCDTLADASSCDFDCTFATCGDGYANAAAGELCDGGGVDTATCDADCTLALCGDGQANVVAGEDCDTAGESATCDPDCSDVTCGDFLPNLAAGEQCDDGNLIDNDGCTNACQMP